MGPAALERIGMIHGWFRWGGTLLASGVLIHGADLASAISTNDQRTVLLVVGHPGEGGYATEFNAWAEKWRKAAELAKAKWIEIGLPATTGEETASSKGPSKDDRRETTGRDKLKSTLEDE